MNDYAFRQRIPYIYGGVVASRGMSVALVPGSTPCLRCMLPNSGASSGETCDTVGVIAPVVDIVASHQAVEALKLLVGAKKLCGAAWLRLTYGTTVTTRCSSLSLQRNVCLCRPKQYPALDLTAMDQVTPLCGMRFCSSDRRGPLDLKDGRRLGRGLGRLSRIHFCCGSGYRKERGWPCFQTGGCSCKGQMIRFGLSPCMRDISVCKCIESIAVCVTRRLIKD